MDALTRQRAPHGAGLGFWGGGGYPKNVESKPARDEKGRLLPGQTANPNGIGGRPRLPDWFKSRGPDALRVLLAQATGEIVADENGKVLPAVQQVATESTAKERAAAAELVANRLYGKAPDVITGDADNPVRASIEVRFVKPGE